MHRSALVTSFATAAVLLAGCGSQDGVDAAPAVDVPTASAQPTESSEPTGPAPSPSTPAAPTASGATDEPTHETAGTGGGGTNGGSGGGTAGGRGGTASSPAGVTEQPPSPHSPVFPEEVVPAHGDEVWAVYLAVGEPDDMWAQHMLGETESYVRGRYGYTGSGIGEVGCDRGAAAQLGFDPDHHRVAVYFASAARAQEFVAVYDRQDVGSAKVTTYCLD